MRRTAIVAAAGAAYGVAFLDAAFAGFTAASLVVLAAAWRSGAPARVALHGFAWGVGAFSVGLAWLFQALHSTGDVRLVVALPVFAAIVIALSASIAGAGALLAWAFASPAARLLAFAPAWWLLEWTRGLPILRFPWLSSGETQVDAWLGVFAPAVGVYGIGFLMAGCAAAAAWSWRRGWRGKSCALVLLATSALAPFPSTQDDAGDAMQVVAIAHPEATALRDAAAIDARLQWYRDASAGAMGAHLVLLPETIVPVLAHDLDGWISDLHRRAADANTSLVVGLPVAGEAHARNAVLGIGAARGVYEKRRLVPFAEYVPFARWLGAAGTLVELPLGRFAHGTRNTLSAGAHRIAAAICYEAAFPELIRRNVREAGTPALLVVPGSDAWFGNAAGRHQILQATRMRAMETGLPIVRSATAGDTLVIDARGRIMQRASDGAPWARASVAPSTGASAWVRFGSVPVALAALLVLVLAGLVELRRTSSNDARSE